MGTTRFDARARFRGYGEECEKTLVEWRIAREARDAACQADMLRSCSSSDTNGQKIHLEEFVFPHNRRKTPAPPRSKPCRTSERLENQSHPDLLRLAESTG